MGFPPLPLASRCVPTPFRQPQFSGSTVPTTTVAGDVPQTWVRVSKNTSAGPDTMNPQAREVNSCGGKPGSRRSSRTRTSSSGDLSCRIDTAHVDNRSAFVQEYNLLAKKVAIRVLFACATLISSAARPKAVVGGFCIREGCESLGGALNFGTITPNGVNCRMIWRADQGEEDDVGSAENYGCLRGQLPLLLTMLMVLLEMSPRGPGTSTASPIWLTAW